MADFERYTFTVAWPAEDGEHVGLCTEFPSLSWLDESAEAPATGISELVAEVVVDMQLTGESIPVAVASRNSSLGT